jgi:uncharacterized protein (DUF1684 family)
MTVTIDTDQQTSAQYAEEWAEWHRRHEAIIGDKHGFLSITSINWLDGNRQRFPDAPGEWSTDSDGVHVDLADGEEITVDGVITRGRHDFGVVPERASITVGWGDAVIEVAKRGGFDIVRPRHPDAPLVTAYHGTPAYQPDPRWVVTGTYVPFATPRPTTVGAAVEGLHHVYRAPGRLEFSLEGKPYALTLFENEHGAGFMALFTDVTSGVTTYAANRSIRVDEPAADGTVVVDFNRATNLPCAYTDLATCPLPPAENHLPVAVETGEKIPYERLTDG